MNQQPPSVLILQQLDLQAPKMAVHNSIPLAKYYSTASDLRTQALIYISEHDDERAYVLLKRFVRMVLLTIADHNAVNQKRYAREKHEFRQYAEEALAKLEVITQNIKDKYDTASAETPSEETEPEPSAPDAEPEEMPNLDELKLEDSTTPSAPPSGSTVPPTMRTHSWDNLKLNFNAGPVERKKPPQPTSSAPVPTYPKIIKGTGPAPPPRPPPPSMPMSSILRLRDVHMPVSVMSEFMEYARSNTVRDIETCGILTGILKDNKFHVTTIVIPKQEATANTCVTHSEEDLFDIQDKKGLLTLGWIHTHPTQTCFLSSIDLHTQFSYQVMLSEAIAIVMAPTANPNQGIFSLTSKGLEILSSCDRRGFHRHADDEGLYGKAQHVRVDTSSRTKCTIIDLRKK